MATPRNRLVGAVVSVAALVGLPACMPGVAAATRRL